MKLFPYILVRIGGLSHDEIQTLVLQRSLPYLNLILKKIKAENTLKKDIYEHLTQIMGRISDYKVRAYIRNIQSDIFNNRNFNPNKLSPLLNNLQDDDHIELKVVIKNLEAYVFLKNEITTLIEKNELVYLEESKQINTNFRKLASDDSLNNGLLLSSHSMFGQLKYFKKRTIYNKKQRQIQESLLVYLTRMSTKTTPFSHFATVALLELKKDDTPFFKNAMRCYSSSAIRLNQQLFLWFQQLFFQTPDLILNSRLKVNPTLFYENEKYQLVSIWNRVEEVRHIEYDAIIELILSILKSENLTVGRLLQTLSEEIDASKEVIQGFVYELVRLGVLNIDFLESEKAENWNIALLTIVNRVEKITNNIIEIKKALTQLTTQRGVYEKSSVIQRKEILGKVLDDLNILSQKRNIPLGLKKEHLFYEDVKTTLDTEVSEAFIKEYTIPLNALVHELQHFTAEKKQQNTFLAFFIKNFGKASTVSLIRFYEAFYKKNRIEEEDEIIHLETKDFQQKWMSTLTQNTAEYLKENESIIRLSIADIKVINEAMNVELKNISDQSFGSHLQFFKNKNKEKQAVVNGIYIGYGKMFSRFLYLLDEKTTMALKNENADLNSGEFGETAAQTFFNANLHPVLMPYQIGFPNSEKTRHKTIKLSDVLVGYDENLNILCLKNKTNNQPIYIHDLEFQANESRSNLHQLLTHFCKTPTHSIHYITNAVNDNVKKENGVMVLPRIVFEDKLVLQRKTWLIEKKALPEVRQKQESEWEYLIRINRWRTDIEVPNRVFVKITTEKTTDNYKPQYIDFYQPTAVLLFNKLMKKTKVNLALTEMLPNENELQRIDNKAYATEFLVQWSTTHS